MFKSRSSDQAQLSPQTGTRLEPHHAIDDRKNEKQQQPQQAQAEAQGGLCQNSGTP